jgi:hypothetical protein
VKKHNSVPLHLIPHLTLDEWILEKLKKGPLSAISLRRSRRKVISDPRRGDVLRALFRLQQAGKVRPKKNLLWYYTRRPAPQPVEESTQGTPT